MSTSSLVTRTSVERFIKAVTHGRRVSADAVDMMIEQIDAIARDLVEKAGEASDDAGRSTLFPEDFQAAYTSVRGEATNPREVFDVIDQLETDELADLVNVITDWLQERQ